MEEVLPGSTRFLARRRRQGLELSRRKAGEDGTGLQKSMTSLEPGRDIGGRIARGDEAGAPNPDQLPACNCQKNGG
jgi:hypothetical protein